MRQLIAQLLVFFLLFAGFAWAADLEVVDSIEHEHQLIHDGGAEPDGPAGVESCNHSCHGIAHLLGLSPTMLAVQHNAGDRHSPPPCLPFYSHASQPPLPPPNA